MTVVKSFHRSVDLINSILKKIAFNQLIKKKDRILLSISGGQDSISLLFLLNQICDQLELHLAFFWCHHLWQMDSFFLMKQIAQLSYLFQFDSCLAIPSHFIPSELLARNWRYNCTSRVSLFYKYFKIGIAHTANDKIETVFLNLMRGTGLTGLSPLHWTQIFSKKLSIAENIQNHVSQLSAFSNSPFFWSVLQNPPSSTLNTLRKIRTVTPLYTVFFIPQLFKDFSRNLVDNDFSTKLIQAKDIKRLLIHTYPASQAQQTLCIHTTITIIPYHHIQGNTLRTESKEMVGRWYVRYGSKPSVPLLSVPSKMGQVVGKVCWTCEAGYVCTGSPVDCFFCYKLNDNAKDNKIIQNFFFLIRKESHFFNLHISATIFLFPKKFSLVLKRVILKKTSLHTINSLTRIKKTNQIRPTPKKWFHSVSDKFFKSCLYS